jgi:hypothetical protein
MGYHFDDTVDSCFSCLEIVIPVHAPGTQIEIPILITTYHVDEWP